VPRSSNNGIGFFATAFSGAVRRQELSSITPRLRFPNPWPPT
jgi:hypothetical protein